MLPLPDDSPVSKKVCVFYHDGLTSDRRSPRSGWSRAVRAVPIKQCVKEIRGVW